MFAADGDVAFVAADFDLGAFAQDGAFGIGAQNHRGFAAAVADGFYLDEIIGPREQVLAALEEVALKIGAQSVGKYGDAKAVSDFPQLKICARVRNCASSMSTQSMDSSAPVSFNKSSAGVKAWASASSPMRDAMRLSPARVSSCGVNSNGRRSRSR